MARKQLWVDVEALTEILNKELTAKEGQAILDAVGLGESVVGDSESPPGQNQVVRSAETDQH